MLLRKVDPGCRIPALYGIVSYDWVDDSALVAPLPLVVPFVLARHLWAGIRTAFRDIARDPRVAYLDGVEAGIRLARTKPQSRDGFIIRAGGLCRITAREH